MAYDKLCDSAQLDADLLSVANAIRTKGGTQAALLFPGGFVDAINAISAGGADEGFLKYLARATGLTYPDGVTDIGDYAFYHYAALLAADIEALPDTLESIGDYAFEYCTGLLAIDLSDKVIESIGDYAFAYCTGATSIDLSDNALETIGEYAFAYCSGITSIDLSGNNLLTLGDYMLTQTGSLTTIDLSDNPNLLSIPSHFVYDSTKTGVNAGPAVNSVILTDTPIEAFEDYAFAKCHSLIYPFAFGGLSTLKSIGASCFRSKLNSTYNHDLDLTGTALETIGNQAFYLETTAGYNGYKGTLSLPTTIQIIGTEAFWGHQFSGIDLTGCEDLVSIGDKAFQRDTATIAEIDFSDCTSLETIGSNCFYHSTNNVHATIRKLTFPSTLLTSIGERAFSHAGLSNQGPLTVRAQSLGANSFYGCTGITEVHVDGTTAYGIAPFSGCTGITTAYISTLPTTFPSNITTYPVFYGCTGLTDIYVSWSQGEVDENKFVKSTQTVTWHYDTQF